MQAASMAPTLCPTCLIVGIEELVTQTQSDHYFRDQGMGFRQHARYARKKLSYACVCIASTIQRYCAEEIFAHATLFCMERKPQRLETQEVANDPKVGRSPPQRRFTWILQPQFSVASSSKVPNPLRTR